jgi:NADH-quinone oxidoreductase subunit C
VTPGDAIEGLQQQFGDAVLDVVYFRDEVSALVPRDRVVEVCRYCRDRLGFNYLSDITAVDWLDRRPRFDVVYHLLSLESWARLRIKVQTDVGVPVPTVIPVWGGANWPEREAYDMFGIEFDGHPDMRRILMPEGWIGYPLRKDFAQTQIALPRPKRDKATPREE